MTEIGRTAADDAAVSPRRARVVLAVQLLLLTTVPLLIVGLSRTGIVDDAYITFRYAAHLVQGDGLVFNKGERVEGTSSPLWALLASLPVSANWAPGKAMFWCSLLFGWLALGFAWRLIVRLGHSSSKGWWCVFAVSCVPDYWLSVGNGMEGGLYSLLLVQMVGAVLLSRQSWIPAVWGGLLFATRPESIAFVVLCPATVTFCQRVGLVGPQRRSGTWLVRMGFWWLLILGSMTLIRYGYYGELLPNTVTAKSVPLRDPTILRETLLQGVRYCITFLCKHPGLFCATLSSVAFLSRHVLPWYVLLIEAYGCTVVIRNGGDWMPHFRLLIVYAPLAAMSLAVLLPAGETKTMPRLAAPSRTQGVIAWTVLLVVLASWRHHRWEPGFAGFVPVEGPQDYARVCGVIRGLLPNGTKVCPNSIGASGYILLDHYVHDPLGLTDRHLARHGQYVRCFGKKDDDYTANVVKPDLYMTHVGQRHLRAYARAYQGDVWRDYCVFGFVPPERSPQKRKAGRWLMAVRRELTSALEPSLRESGLTPLDPQTLGLTPE